MRRAAVVLFLVVTGVALAGEPAPPKDWREVAAKVGLPSDAVDKLGRTKVLVGPDQCKQVFTPYVGEELPPFVTSDSILHAYHVLLEEGVARVERARVLRLEEFLRTLWDGIPGAAKKFDLAPEKIADAERRARLTVGTALRVLGAETPGADEETTKLLDEETRRVLAATERSKPAWLGPPDETFPFIDYGRFRPAGFYAGDEALSRYWRAVSWLQAIPFRLTHTDELTAALLLRDAPDASATDPDRAFLRSWHVKAFLRDLSEFVGGGDDLPVTCEFGLATATWHADSIAEAGRDFANMGRARGENDERAMRVLPPAVPADVRLLEATKSTEPAGLSVAAALGSTLARERVKSSDPKALAVIDGLHDFAGGHDLHAAYLRCLQALVDAPEKDAPEFVRGDAWAAKSLNALLAGWAQERHTFGLQVREPVYYMSASIIEPGYVEPDPEFFSRLADLAVRASVALAAGGAFSDESGRAELALSIRRHIELVASSKVISNGTEALRGFPGQDAAFIDGMVRFADAIAGRPSLDFHGSEQEKIASIRRSVDELGKLLTPIESGGALPPIAADATRSAGVEAIARWNRLESVCRRLEAMAHKQLRGVAWSAAERGFLHNYGEELAHLVGYDGDSWHDPRDDVPRATSVLAVHAARAPGAPAVYVHAAVGRPRPIYVLYPAGDHEVLCRGAVMTYYEFTRDARLVDTEWRAVIDTPQAPAPPEWFGAVTSTLRPSPWGAKR